MPRIITPEFFNAPPPIMLRQMAQERLIARYESLLESWSRVLAALAQNAGDMRRVNAVRGGISFPYAWTANLPAQFDLNVVEDADEKRVVVRLLTPAPRAVASDATRAGWQVPDEQKRAEDAAQQANVDGVSEAP